jgi:hypothetical protein
MTTALAEPPARVHVTLAGHGLECFGAWCFDRAVLEAHRGPRPPVRYCAKDLVAYLRELPPGSEITYSLPAETLLKAEGQEVIR